MTNILDGNIYSIAFRLHDNRYKNSPKAIYNGGGFLRSDILALGEPGFDPVRRHLSIGIGGNYGLSLMAADTLGNIRFDITSLVDKHGYKLNYDTLSYYGVPLLGVSYGVVNISTSLTMLSGTDVEVQVGYGHMLAATSLLYNIKTALLKAVSNTLTNNDVDKLFNTPSGRDMTRLNADFRAEYGVPTNLLADSEDFSGDTALDAHVVSNSSLSPHSDLTASELVSDTDDVDDNIAYIVKSCAVDENTRYSAAIYVKELTSPIAGMTLGFTGGTAEEISVSVDWSTKVVTVDAPDATWQGGVLVDKNGFYRLWATGPSGDNDTLALTIFVRDRDSTVHVINEANIIWGATANLGGAPIAYIKT